VYELLKSYVEDISSFKGLVEVKANHQYNVSYEHIDNSYYNVFHVLLNTLSEKEKEYLLDVALESNERAATIFLKNPEVKLTPAQFNTVFNNKHHSRHSIRKAVIGNKNIPLSMEQVNEGLLKWDDGLNIVYAQRGHSCVLKKTIDILINETNSDSCFNEDVLEELLKNKNLHFDEMQIKHFLNSDNFILRAECARNYNIPFTPEQIIQGLFTK
jgi:hypothetical protein